MTAGPDQVTCAKLGDAGGGLARCTQTVRNFRPIICNASTNRQLEGNSATDRSVIPGSLWPATVPVTAVLYFTRRPIEATEGLPDGGEARGSNETTNSRGHYRSSPQIGTPFTEGFFLRLFDIAARLCPRLRLQTTLCFKISLICVAAHVPSRAVRIPRALRPAAVFRMDAPVA